MSTRRMSISYMLRTICKVVAYPFNKIRFRSFHISSRIVNPILLTPSAISIGRDVFVFTGGRIEGVLRDENRFARPEIVLEDGVSIQQNVHITCAERIRIGKNTAIAANVTITDIVHPYEDVSRSIEAADIQVHPVEIGEDCKINNNAVILPGIKIGKHCVIGANSVVTHDIPDYSVAVGSPAHVVKRYDTETQTWKKVEE